MRKTLITILAAATALVACSKSEAPVADQSRKAVRFTVQNLGTYEFKSSPLVALGVDGNSKVGIYAPDLGANNVPATVDGSTLDPDSPIYWNIGQTTNTMFVARYPYANDATMTDYAMSYTIPDDQSGEETFAYHSNVMFAVATANPTPGTVAFSFKHPFAKVAISITNNLDADNVASVVMKNVKMDATSLDLTVSPAAATLSSTVSETLTARAIDATNYALIIMPQDATNTMDIVVTTRLGSVYTFRNSGEYSFQAGKVSTVSLTLDPIGGGSGSGRTSVGTMSFVTVDWSDAASQPSFPVNGDPTIGDDYYWIEGCVYAIGETPVPSYWANRYYMESTGVNTWTISFCYNDEMAGGDTSGFGFVIRHGSDYYKMYNGHDGHVLPACPLAGYELKAPNASDSENIRFSQSGKYTITYNSSTRVMFYERTGDL